MNRVKYFFVANVLNYFLQIGFVLAVIVFVVNFSADVFQLKKYFRYGYSTIGITDQGYRLKAMIRSNMPDTIISYKDGQTFVYNEHSYLPSNKRVHDANKHKTKTEIIANSMKSYVNDEVFVYNKFSVSEPADVYVNSKNKIYTIFWSLVSNLDLLFSIFFFLLLIKLLNRYTKNLMFEERTFKLIAGFGWLIIAKEVLAFIFGYINNQLIGMRHLETADLLNHKRYNFIDIKMDFFNVFSFSKVGVGLLILLIAYVVKEAISAKKENELTI